MSRETTRKKATGAGGSGQAAGAPAVSASGESARPKGRGRQLTIHVTHRYVSDPEAVERGIELWVSLLAEALRRKLAAEMPAIDTPAPAEPVARPLPTRRRRTSAG